MEFIVHLLGGHHIRVLATLKDNFSGEGRELHSVPVAGEPRIPGSARRLVEGLRLGGTREFGFVTRAVAVAKTCVRKGGLYAHTRPGPVASRAIKQRCRQRKMFQAWRILRQKPQKKLPALLQPDGRQFRDPGLKFGFTFLKLLIRATDDGLPYFWDPTYVCRRRGEVAGVGK